VAVYKRGYSPYEGALAPEWARFLVIARYAYARVFDSKLLITFFVICFLPIVVSAIIIYLPHNAAVKEVLGTPRGLRIDAEFFSDILRTQAVFAFLLTAFIGPGLVSADLSNNALPLYFCRGFSRTEYVAGKMIVLAMLLSAIAWVPVLLLYGFQAALMGWTWTADNLHIAWGILAGGMVWILMLCLLALAVSASVKRRVVAGGMILGIFFVGAGFGAAFNEALNTHIGDVFNIVQVLGRIWSAFFQVPARTELTVEVAWMALTAGAWLCLFLLNRKVRAYEVVK
jgi:ABC-2 type transport system permease protein